MDTDGNVEVDIDTDNGDAIDIKEYQKKTF